MFCILGEFAVDAFGPDSVGSVSSLYTRNGAKNGVTYHVDYLFSFDGRTLSDTETVGEGYFKSLTVNGPVKVHVAKLGSWNFSELDQPWSEYVLGLLAEKLLCAIFPIFIFRSPFSKTLETDRLTGEDARLVRTGLPTYARVIRAPVQRCRTSETTDIAYRYVLPDGRSFDCKVGREKLSWFDRYVGAPVLILYDPTDPSVHRIYRNMAVESAGMA